MKNLKKILLSLMVVFLVVGFIGCKTETDPVPPEQETPAGTNKFKGNVFVGMTGEGEKASFASYIIFTSDKDCEVYFFGESIPATYTVADDVVTLTGTGEYAEHQLSTTKLTDGKFTITIPPAVSGEKEDIVVSYAVGTMWTIFYDIPDSDKDFTFKMPEEALDIALKDFEENDYTKDDATKTVTLTASGWAKVEAAMGGGGKEPPVKPDPNKPGQETPAVTNNFMRKAFIGKRGEGKNARISSWIIFTSDNDCEVYYNAMTIPATYTVADDAATLKGTGEYAELQLSTTKLTDGKFSITIPADLVEKPEDIVVSYAVGTLWTIFYDIPDSDEDFTSKGPEELLENALKGFIEGTDYTKNDATNTITLTESGWEKAKAAMGD